MDNAFRYSAYFKGLLISAVICVLCLAGCENKPAIVAAPTPLKKVSSAELKNMEERLQKLLAPLSHVYNPEGKPDPFQPFLRKSNGGKGPEGACTTPLECMDLGELSLTAIVSEPGGRMLAMVQDASGKGYVIKKGIRVGYNKGVVKDVLPDRVVVEEESEDMRGQLLVRERILLLHPEGQ
ncbi:MAG: pilus assembly protein PilP [Dissulfurimicrobium sp.]|uniref:pilus assembly protein PilP n=1 Tax=Dissulfurimicrobium sp. TaxID=2022436 RepID=UPI00404990DF